MRPIIFMLMFSLNCHSVLWAQSQPQNMIEFNNAILFAPKNRSIEQSAVTLRLTADSVIIESRKTRDVIKQFKYGEIKSAEHSYSQYPRWKEGVGASAAGVAIVGASLGTAAVFPLAPLIALPIFIKTAKMKGKKYWLTIKTKDDFAVLRLDKSNDNVIIPALETRAGIKVEIIAAER